MSYHLVDFHCHLDLYPDFESLFRICEDKGVYALAVTTTPRAWPRNRELASTTKNVKAALGLHPQLVSEKSHELSLWKEYLPSARYVGEVGLDAGPRFYKSFNLQKEVFESILKSCSTVGHKVLSVHSVRCAPVVLDMINTHLDTKSCKVVLHWFTGGLKDAKKALDLGCYFSVNSAMLGNKRNRDFFSLVPVERLLTETDGPFTYCGDRPAHPEDVLGTVHELATLKGLEPASLSKQIIKNLHQLESEVNCPRIT